MSANIRQLAPSFVVALLCGIFSLTNTSFGFDSNLEISNSLLYHFSHANIFHLLANLVALFTFRPRWTTCAYGYLAASVASVLPFAWMADEPTCGLSGFVFACWARRYWSFRIKPFYIFGISLVSVFIPHVNWRIHLYSFILAIIIYATREVFIKRRNNLRHT